MCYKYSMGEFMTLTEENITDENKISRVANVEVKLSAELGRTKLPLKDVIEYDTGSIIVLDRLNNEPIDVFVNDILIARGKIVAIEDTYGIKISEIINNNPEEKEENG